MRYKTKLYICGPMTGIKNFNFPAFNKAAKDLESLNFKVVNPASFQEDTEKTWDYYMRKDIIEMLRKCDKIVTLPGWEKSQGAKLEVYIAKKLGFKVFHIDDLVKNREINLSL